MRRCEKKPADHIGVRIFLIEKMLNGRFDL
jgi:hypothetical protein